ncbi:MAG: hypothetical protein WKF37_13555 [Bryobacteraceae bacterium]
MTSLAVSIPKTVRHALAEAEKALATQLQTHQYVLGRYVFTLPDTVARGELRPLRDPNTASLDEA